jgi:hypothetical protein
LRLLGENGQVIAENVVPQTALGKDAQIVLVKIPLLAHMSWKLAPAVLATMR